MKPILEKVERIEAWEHGYHDGIFVVSTQTEGLHRPPHTILEIIQEIFAGKVYHTKTTASPCWVGMTSIFQNQHLKLKKLKHY